MPKGSTLSSDQISRIQELRAKGMSIDDVSAQLHVSRTSVSRHGPPQTARLNSGAARLMRALADLNGMVEAAPDLMERANRIDPGAPVLDLHNAVHLLWRLNKRGFMTFKESKQGTSTIPFHIKLTPAGWSYLNIARHHRVGDTHDGGGTPLHPSDRTDYRTHKSTAEVVPPAVTVKHVPEWATWTAFDRANYPELHRLRERQEEIKAVEERVDALMEAASLLESHSFKEEAEALTSKAADLVGSGLSPAELEYLRVADDFENMMRPAKEIS